MDQFKALPILAVTGKVVPGERDRCLQAGANEYIAKPVSTEELLAAIGPWLPASGPDRIMTVDPGLGPGQAATIADAVTSTVDPPPVSVLIVDDNPSKRLALTAALTPLGYAIVEADSGLAALRCVMHQDFAVILLDVRMPIMDGFETARRIRQRRQSEMTPIIFITAFAGDEFDQADRFAEGAVDFMLPRWRPRSFGPRSRSSPTCSSRPVRWPPGVRGRRRRRTSSACSPRPPRSASSRPTPRTATSTPIPDGPRSPASRPSRRSGQPWDIVVGHRSARESGRRDGDDSRAGAPSSPGGL